MGDHLRRADAVRPVPKAPVKTEGKEFMVEGEMEGSDVKELNRSLLSALRRVEKRTKLPRSGPPGTAQHTGSSTVF